MTSESELAANTDFLSIYIKERLKRLELDGLPNSLGRSLGFQQDSKLTKLAEVWMFHWTSSTHPSLLFLGQDVFQTVDTCLAIWSLGGRFRSGPVRWRERNISKYTELTKYTVGA